MRKNLFICFLLCSLTAFSCGPSSDEINRITAENTRLKEENMALITEVEQCKSELETLKKKHHHGRAFDNERKRSIG